MKLLLDTHVLIWAIEGYSAAPAVLREAITDPENELYISIAAFWEAAIKISLGKLSVPGGTVGSLFEFARRSGTVVLPLSEDDLRQLERLPWHHRDPFDRLMIAQALVRGLRFVSADDTVRQYLPDAIG